MIVTRTYSFERQLFILEIKKYKVGRNSKADSIEQDHVLYFLKTVDQRFAKSHLIY